MRDGQSEVLVARDGQSEVLVAREGHIITSYKDCNNDKRDQSLPELLSRGTENRFNMSTGTLITHGHTL